MDPFFGNRHWYQQSAPNRYPPFRRDGGVPIYEVADRAPSEPKKSPPKVVKIPVHFVGSERVVDRSGAAVKIQRVFRGFLVRKCLRKIKDLKVQVDGIGERLSKSEVVEMVRRDEKERLRLNESLMSLLFKLDSICGVDFGVRSCRKAVIRKVIALQERIDAITAVEMDGNCENADQEVENEASKLEGNSIETEDCVDVIDVGVDSEVKVSEINCDKNGGGDGDFDILDEKLTEKDETVRDCGDCVEGRKRGNDDNARNGELLERMLEDNEKMMNMMTQLFERNETQMRMLNALTHRVELLEKAFVCDKLRRKKKKKGSNAAAAAVTED